MSISRNLKYIFLKWSPRKRKLKGGMIHRVIGDRLFDPGLWKITVQKTAAGMAIGTFVAFTPTLGFQMILATILAFVLRVNIPAAIMAVWITNPVTIPIIYPLEFKLGYWISSVLWIPEIADFQQPLEGAGDVLKIADIPRNWNLFRNTKYLVIGSLLASTFFSLLTYGVFYFLFRRFSYLRKKKAMLKRERE